MASLAEKRALVENLRRPPIIEAVVDIDCDMPPELDLAALREPGLAAFRDPYSVAKKHFVAGQQLETKDGEPVKFSVVRGLQGLRFSRPDNLQLVQVRAQGFSFNRLAPYSNLDDYLPEIERAYGLFRDLARPVQIQRIALRYINRIFLPFRNGVIKFHDFLERAPRVPEEEEADRFDLRGFLHHDTFTDRITGNHVNRVITLQPVENDLLPLLFDNAASRHEKCPPDDWTNIRKTILALRSLKNEIFADTLTEGCLRLFQ